MMYYVLIMYYYVFINYTINIIYQVCKYETGIFL